MPIPSPHPRSTRCGAVSPSPAAAAQGRPAARRSLPTWLLSSVAALSWLLVCAAATNAQLPPAATEFFATRTAALSQQSARELAQVTPDQWPETQARWREELKEMLGLQPWPDKTDLQVTQTGSIEVEGTRIDRLHYQSRPGLYVAANLYTPVGSAPAAGWPAVLYVCGHARVTDQGRLLGNKTNYQHHALWLARHGVVCLVIDTVQLGELHGEHHGTYKLGRWDWISRGYTPAGVEAWNAIRGVDLLCSLPDVDSQRIGITGRSGGGAYSWFAAALDDRIRVAVPVAGITDLHNHVLDGCVEGHCDCMYFVNYFGWDYGKLAALVAPRALLLANSDSDGIFPLDGVMRIHQQLVEHYRRLDATDQLGLLLTPGPHQDTQELQVGAFKWLLRHLTDQTPRIDSAADKELPPSSLAVFEAEIPKQERVTAVSSWFVPSSPSVADASQAAALWQTRWLAELRRLGQLPSPSAAAWQTAASGQRSEREWKVLRRDVEGGALRVLALPGDPQQPPLVHVMLHTRLSADGEELSAAIAQAPEITAWLARFPNRTHYFVRWRGAAWMDAATSVKAEHQLVRRFYLLGSSPEAVQMSDVLAVIQWLDQQHPQFAVDLAGEGRYAALAELTALVASTEYGLKIATVHAANRTTDPLLTPVLPGLLRITNYENLHAAAEQLLKVEELSFEATAANELVDTSSEPQQASGLRIVEVDQQQAHIWVRATRWPLPNLGDLPEVRFEKPAKSGKQNQNPLLPEQGVDGLRFAVPGVAAWVRVSHRPQGQGGNWQYSDWEPVDAATDYSTLVRLEGLSPNTAYEVRTHVRSRPPTAGDESASSTLSGQFRTLPAEESQQNFRLAIGTCQDFNDRDGPHGFDVYRTLLSRETDAFVLAGDVVYYDALARSTPLAFYHWQRTYSLPTLLEFHRRVPTYFLKDDHDTYVDDSWPGTRFAWTGEFTFEDGQRIFREQTGLPSPAYRTFRLTKDLQIWLMEGRDFRSPNNAPDGPQKSIWGEAQKEWLKNSLQASTARFRIVISPTPLVGPDRDNKKDNHSNRVFANEGREVRALLASIPNTISVCGDRHWQFHSIDPETGLHEFSVGPVSDRHAGGWKPQDFRPEVHQFLRVAGGYLEVELTAAGDSPTLQLNLRDTHGRLQHRHTLQ